jgi:hypothetical protein
MWQTPDKSVSASMARASSCRNVKRDSESNRSARIVCGPIKAQTVAFKVKWRGDGAKTGGRGDTETRRRGDKTKTAIWEAGEETLRADRLESSIRLSKTRGAGR